MDLYERAKRAGVCNEVLCELLDSTVSPQWWKILRPNKGDYHRWNKGLRDRGRKGGSCQICKMPASPENVAVGKYRCAKHTPKQKEKPIDFELARKLLGN